MEVIIARDGKGEGMRNDDENGGRGGASLSTFAAVYETPRRKARKSP
jgi:hypothetical protein